MYRHAEPRDSVQISIGASRCWYSVRNVAGIPQLNYGDKYTIKEEYLSKS